MADKKERTEEELTKELSKLRLKMKDGAVSFEFEKKDGSIRKAKGTLKNDLIPEEHRSDDRKRKTSETVFNYFDLDKEDWRCFLKQNFLGIIK